MNPWPVIRAALSRYRFSSLAFVLLVAAGVSLSVALVSQERALRTGSGRAAEKFDLIVAPPGSRTDALLTGVFLRAGTSQLLPAALTSKVLSDPRAAFASPLAFGDSHRGAPVVGVTAALVEHLSGGLGQGRNLQRPNEAVVGAASKLQVGDKFSPRHGTHHRENDHDEHAEDSHAVEVTVVGRMKPTGSPWDRAVLVPVELVWQQHGLPNGHAPQEGHIGQPFDAAHTPGVPAVVVHTPNVAQAYRLRRAYTGSESMAFFPAEALVQLYAVLGDMRQLMSALAVVTQALVLLAITASMFILFRLLMPQFVTLRALGAPRAYIFAIAWGYTALLVGAGVAAGLAGGYGLSHGISAWLAHLTGLALAPSLGEPEVLTALAILVVGLVLATLPAWHVRRTSLADALKAY